MPNPLKMDPSRTTMLRNAFRAEMRRRFRILRNHVWEFILEQDVLGLEESSPFQLNQRILTLEDMERSQMREELGDYDPDRIPAFELNFAVNVIPERQAYRFLTSDKKLEAFNSWFKRQVEADVLQVSGAGDPWTAKYVGSAYKKGAIRAYTDAHKEIGLETPDFYRGRREEFLQSSFAGPEQVAKLRMLATRSFEELKGVTAAMGQQMNRVLSDGISQGLGPRTIARRLDDSISGLTRTRAEVIARTEVIHAHAEGQLDAFEALGVEEVGLMAEWSTAGDELVCEECLSLEGEVMTVEEARGMIPLHPNCRCAWIPAEKAPEKKEKGK